VDCPVQNAIHRKLIFSRKPFATYGDVNSNPFNRCGYAFDRMESCSVEAGGENVVREIVKHCAVRESAIPRAQMRVDTKGR
jgi:hypothetical protein